MSVIYTDGSCVKNNAGGWAFCFVDADADWYLSDGVENTTNNRMELMAVIEAIKFVSSKDCIIYTDSQLVKNCAEGVWKRKCNMDLWSLYDIVSMGKNIKYIWVKAHNGDFYNEKVDKLANMEAKKIFLKNNK